MKYTTVEVVEKLKIVNSEFTEEKLNLILDTFFNVDTRPPLNSATFKWMREQSGLNFNGKYMAKEVDALVVLGFELAPTASEKTSKSWMIAQVQKQVNASEKVIVAVYKNLIGNRRATADALSRKLPDIIGEGAHRQTIKKIEGLFENMGALVKPYYQSTGGKGGTKGKKFSSTVALDDGIIRWNPAKLMPKPFAHLDNAW